jgi:hypothetical protein
MLSPNQLSARKEQKLAESHYIAVEFSAARTTEATPLKKKKKKTVAPPFIKPTFSRHNSFCASISTAKLSI